MAPIDPDASPGAPQHIVHVRDTVNDDDLHCLLSYIIFICIAFGVSTSCCEVVCQVLHSSASVSHSSVTSGVSDGLTMGKSIAREYRIWDQPEEDALRAGVKKHGLGAWERIRTDPDFSALV